MNTTKYMQTDGRWGGLGYPKKPYYIRNCGCGEVSIANILLEISTSYTPANIQPYCKQYADPHGNGTYWSGIPAMLKHYGLTEVKEHATMKPLWTELAKGNRVAVYLMGSRRGGTKGVHWTSGGHFVCSVGYKYEGGKHWVYVKDSYSNSSLRNGWITYEDNMRNDVLKVWSGKLPGKAPTPTPKGKLVVDGIGGLATVNRLQEFLGVPQTDGITIRKDLQKYVPALKAYDYGNGSPTVKAMQKWLGLSNPDGLWGANTSKGLQKKLGVTADGIAGKATFKALQKYLNEHDKAVYPIAPAPKPAPTPVTSTWADKAVAWAKAIANDQSWHYVKWTDNKKTHECPICHNHPKGKYHGWNCIGFAYSCLFHGAGINIKHSNGVINNAKAESILKAKTDASATKLVTDALNNKNFTVIRNNKKVVPQSKMKPGDIGLYFKGNTYVHTFFYIGNGKMVDCTSAGSDANNIKVHSACSAKVIIRYTGK